MSEYYVLTLDDTRDDLESVVGYEMGGFDLTTFWRGMPFRGEIPNSVRLWLGEGMPAEFLANPLSWPIISDEFWAAFEPLIGESCQLYRAPIYKKESGMPVTRFAIMNVITKINAAARRNDKGRLSINDLILNKSLIKNEQHIFRLMDCSTIVVCSDKVVERASVCKTNGLAFLPIKTINGNELYDQ